MADTLEEAAKTISRRDFLKGSVAMGGALATRNVPSLDVEQQAEIEQPLEELVAEVEALSLEDLEYEMYEKYPVVPDIEPIRDRLNTITDIPENSNLMKAGTSVASGMLESIFGENIDQREIDLGQEQFKLELVFSHFQIPPESFDGAVLTGSDAVGLLDPMQCSSEICRPNESTLDAYVREYNPKVAINFVGTNMLRGRTSLMDFANNIEMLIDYYVSKGVVPILTTMPLPANDTDEEYVEWFNNPVVPETKDLYGKPVEEWIEEEIEYRSVFRPGNAFKHNVLLLRMSEKYEVPIINLQRGIVESVVENGNVMPSATVPERDPAHFSHVRPEEVNALKLPATGGEFATGEEAVSYFTIQTLYEILKDAS